MQCCNTTSHKNGLDRLGYQRYRCPICGKTTSGNPRAGKTGRKPIGERAMTEAEKKRRQRRLKKESEQG